MKTSVIIVSYQSQENIVGCLESLKEYNDFEVNVVDNASSDQTVKLIKEFSHVTLIENKENLGFAKANNIGVKESTGEYLFFLNPDCEVEKDTVEKLSSFLSKNKETAVVGPKIVNQDSSTQQEISPFPTLISEIFVLLRLHRVGILKKIVYPNYDYNKTQQVDHLMGSALMIHRGVFEELGGFDENFFLWFEETDLLKRIHEAGYKITYYPETSVTHAIGQSTKQLNFFNKQTIWNKSLIYYFRKHKGWVKLLLLVPFITLSYPAALVSYLVKR